MRDLTRGPILSAMLWFALPLFIGNFFQLLYNTADAFVVGQTLGDMALASVGSTGSINFFVLGFAGGMSSGFAIIIAQRFGAKDLPGIRHSYFTGLILVVAISIVLSIPAVIWVRQILQLMQTPANIIDNAQQFLRVLFAGMIVTTLYNFLSNAMRALGNTRTPLYALIISSIINIGFEYLAILVFHAGVWGASLGTVCAQLLSVLFLAVYIQKKMPQLRFSRDIFYFSLREIREHLRLGLPMGFQYSVIAIGQIVLQIALNTLGADVVASYAITSRVDSFANIPMNTMGSVMATFAAQNYGAKQFKRILRGLYCALTITVVWGLVMFVLLVLFHQQVTTIFIAPVHTHIIDLARQYYLINGSMYWLLAILFVTRNMIQGLGNALVPTICSFMELGMRVTAAIVGVSLMSYVLVVSANPLAYVGSTSVLIPTTIRIIRRFRRGENWRRPEANPRFGGRGVLRRLAQLIRLPRLARR